MYVPNYKNARKTAGFRWNIQVQHHVLFDISDVTIREYNMHVEKGIELFSQKNRKKLIDILGEGIPIPSPITPPISYGHINCLGFELKFPENGEVNYIHQKLSLDKYIDMLNKPVEFSEAGMAPFYIEYYKRLSEAFPEENTGFCFSSEGPLTTAYTLLDTDIFYKLYDEPDKVKKLLGKLVISIVEFRKFQARVKKLPEFNKNSFGLYDDVAAMIPPDMWDELVIPYWDIYYKGLTDGKRMLHCEDMTVNHLEKLEKINIDIYDPSISPKINPELINKNTRVPFKWLMGSFHYRDLDETDIYDLVFRAVEDGTSHLFTRIESGMLDTATVKKIRAFHDACTIVDNMFLKGASRNEIGKLSSAKGRKKFWDEWPLNK